MGFPLGLITIPAGRHGVTDALTIYSPIAQLVEQLTVNQLVVGSSPARGAINKERRWKALYLA